MMPGHFITFEGGEGAGKSTQIRHLAAALGLSGHAVTITREPGGSPLAEALRALLLDPAAADRSPLAEALLFNAARADHLRHTVRPALARGDFVLCDRFADSTRAYQGAASGVPDADLATLERLVVGSTKPDLTVILDLPASVGLQRAAARAGTSKADRFEAADLNFHERLRQAFLGIAAAEPNRCVVVDAAKSETVIAAEVLAIVRARFR